MDQFKDKLNANNSNLNISINAAGKLISDSINNLSAVIKQHTEFQQMNSLANLCSNDLNVAVQNNLFNEPNKDLSDTSCNKTNSLTMENDVFHDSNSNTSNISGFNSLNLESNQQTKINYAPSATT